MTTYTVDNNFVSRVRHGAVRSFIYLVLLSALAVSVISNAFLGFYSFSQYQRAEVCELKLSRAMIPEATIGELFTNRIGKPVSNTYHSVKSSAESAWNSVTSGW